jgi:hypothetical protein
MDVELIVVPRAHAWGQAARSAAELAGVDTDGLVELRPVGRGLAVLQGFNLLCIEGHLGSPCARDVWESRLAHPTEA